MSINVRDLKSGSGEDGRESNARLDQSSLNSASSERVASLVSRLESNGILASEESEPVR